MTEEIINPYLGKPMRLKAADVVRQAREARRGAQEEARSGNPAKRIPARQALQDIPRFIDGVYRQDMKAQINEVPEA